MLRYSDLVPKHDQEPLDAGNYQLAGEQGDDEQPDLMIEVRDYGGSDINEDMDTDGDLNSDLDEEIDLPWETTMASLNGTAAREGTMVTVILEPQYKVYKVYKALLVKHSEYFKKALMGPWKEAEDRVVRIEDVESYTFDVFVDWLHTKRLPELDQHWRPEDDGPDGRQTTMAYVQAYVFGDRFQAQGFKHDMSQKLFDGFIQHVPFYDTIIYAYAHLPEEDDLLQLLVKVQCAHWESEIGEGQEIDERKRLPTDFLVRVMVRFGEFGTNVPFFWDKR
ncbi:uncharacterized protein EKO05_0007566 [Ascochyta rabiei]|nr:uncharacterized protein EKO05_0007566 [Ascochyta rabiei]UPX17197.1 hypothetical protein EKO05_0007566 [Ascochyta rabiei]